MDTFIERVHGVDMFKRTQLSAQSASVSTANLKELGYGG